MRRLLSTKFLPLQKNIAIMKKIELLAPAKNRESAFAAIDYGADAIYMGGAHFGARHSAANSIDDVAAVVAYAHAYGVRVHCTLNTLIFPSELAAAEAEAREIVAAGVDALIVQDMAFARMGLGVDLHASTQMCNMSADWVNFLSQCGFSRVVLERALSLEQIRSIASRSTVEIEAFVHGAICVGHSGRCYLSRSLSQRSGNRGECSQPCRLPYDLLDAGGRKILEGKHLLSVRDLNLSLRVGEMLDAGVSSFKVEGRLKDIGYTKNIVAHYRRTIDEQLAQRPHLERSSQGESPADFTPNPSKSFTRGESEYLFSGQCGSLASFDTPKAVGERLGVVEQRRGSAFRLRSAAQLSAGDGVCFVTSEGLKGTNINRVEGEWFTPNRPDGLERGVELFRNFDKAFNDSVEGSRTRRTIGVDAYLSSSPTGLSLSYTDQSGLSATVSREIPLELPKSEDKMRQVALSQISKSGDTIFAVRSTELSSPQYFIASSLLSQMRREALEMLHERRVQSHTVAAPFVEKMSAKLPEDHLSAEYNVVNDLARAFYTDHGAKSIEQGHDLTARFDEQRVMQSSYCIRREIGECLREQPRLRGDLYIERGGQRYRLDFDCQRCMMNLISIK